MLARVSDLIADMKANPPPLPESERTESVEFMEWLVAENFTFLGIREYRVTGHDREPQLIPDSGLGVLRRADAHELRARAGQEVITAALHKFYAEPTALLITKASLRSRVHRRVFMDMVSVKCFDANGNVCGEFRIVGLFTSTAYTRSTRSIPYLRKRWMHCSSVRDSIHRGIPARRWSMRSKPIRATTCSASTTTCCTNSRC